MSSMEISRIYHVDKDDDKIKIMLYVKYTVTISFELWQNNHKSPHVNYHLGTCKHFIV